MIITENEPAAISGSGFLPIVKTSFTFPRPCLYGDFVKPQSKASRTLCYLESKGSALKREDVLLASSFPYPDTTRLYLGKEQC